MSIAVLILVLMEDTLRVFKMEKKSIIENVLILVLMEDTLRAITKRRNSTLVLILVLMEDTLRAMLAAGLAALAAS